jgi:hypothetical protein
MEYKRNTATAKREVRRRRQRASWDKSVLYLEHETYRTQPKVLKTLKQIIETEKKQQQFKET